MTTKKCNENTLSICVLSLCICSWENAPFDVKVKQHCLFRKLGHWLKRKSTKNNPKPKRASTIDMLKTETLSRIFLAFRLLVLHNNKRYANRFGSFAYWSVHKHIHIHITDCKCFFFQATCACRERAHVAHSHPFISLSLSIFPFIRFPTFQKWEICTLIP